MWLRDFLPEEIPEARIMTYGYDSKATAKISFDDLATTLLSTIEKIRTQDVGFNIFSLEPQPLLIFLQTGEKQPIVFICYSLGGIVVKRVCRSFRGLEFEG